MVLKGLCKCFFLTIFFTVIGITLLALIPNFPPYTELSKSASVPKPRPLVGTLALNERLKGVEIIHKGKVLGPEAFEEYNGELYTSTHGGIVVKVTENQLVTVYKTGKPCKGIHQERICGRPLGFKFGKDGYLYVADAYYGILKVNLKTGHKEVLVSPDDVIEGKKPKLFNSVALASNGDIYWTDSSAQFQLDDLIFDSISDGSGRLIHYDIKTKKNKVLIDSLRFANGVALSENEDYVIAAESFYSRIHRYYLKGPRRGTSDIFIDNLPGLPDNIRQDDKGGFYIPLVESIDEEHPSIVQILLPFPFARKAILRTLTLIELGFKTLNEYYPSEFAERAIHFVGSYGSIKTIMKSPFRMIIHLSKDGDVIENFSTTEAKISAISDVFIYKDHMYLGSPINDYIGKIPISTLGLEKGRVKRTVEEPKQVPPPKQKVTTTTTTTTPKPTTTTQKATTTTPKPTTTTTPKPTTTTPKPTTTTTPKPTTTTQKATTTTSKPTTTTTPKPTTTTPKPTTTSKPSTTTQKPTTAPPKQQTPPAAKSTAPPPPKTTASPPKQQTQPPKQQTPPPSKQQTPPPKQEAPKQQTPPPKQQTPPTKQQTPPVKEQVKSTDSKAKNEL